MWLINVTRCFCWLLRYSSSESSDIESISFLDDILSDVEPLDMNIEQWMGFLLLVPNFTVIG